MPVPYPLNGQRLTSDFMYPLIELWMHSGRTQQSICEEYNIKPHTFNYWRSKYRKENEASKISEEDTPYFVPIKVDAQTQDCLSYFAEIHYTDGTILRIGQPIDIQILKEILPS